MKVNGLSGLFSVYHRLSASVVFELAKRTAVLAAVVFSIIIIRNSLKKLWNRPFNGALIDHHITDLTKLASERGASHLKFRLDLLKTCIKSLNSGMNLIIVGDNGCGKTTFLEQLPFVSIKNNFPDRILRLDLSSLMSRSDPLIYIDHLISSLGPKDLLVIDDIHVGSDSDVFERLKKACESKKIHLIATTNTHGWNQIIKKSPISSVCTHINILNLSLEQIVECITAYMRDLEKAYGCAYEPDVNVLILRVIREFKISIRKIKDSLQLSIFQIEQGKTVSEESFRAILAQQLGLPAHALGGMSIEIFNKIKSSLESSILGQRAALSATCNALQIYFAGLQERDKPIGGGGFLFVGPTGTGKTSLAVSLAEVMCSGFLTQISMANYREEHSVSGLIGSPPGYVGHEDGGLLTNSVSGKEFQVVLLDEIEKAHPKVLQILLQIMDKGWTTDAAGRRVNFNRTIIVMTSNLGSDIRNPSGDGFISQEEMEKNISESINKFFPPEFLGRLRKITFYPLSPQELRDVFHLEFSKFKGMVEDKGINLEIERCVEGFIFAIGLRDGPRDLKKRINDLLTVPLSEQIMKFPSSQSFTARVVDSRIVIAPVSN